MAWILLVRPCMGTPSRRWWFEIALATVFTVQALASARGAQPPGPVARAMRKATVAPHGGVKNAERLVGYLATLVEESGHLGAPGLERLAASCRGDGPFVNPIDQHANS